LQTRPPEKLAEALAAVAAGGEWRGELQQVRKDSSAIAVESTWAGRGTAKARSIWQLNNDLSRWREAKQALQRTEERHRRFINEDLSGNLTMRPDGSILACNPAFMRSFGFASLEEALASNFHMLLRDRQEAAELFAAVKKHGSVERHELEMRQPGGDPVYVAARLVGTFDGAGELAELHGYLFNDTRRKRLEQQLIQAQKMEGLGTLAGGIAHDFNNILSIILGYASQVEARATRPEQLANAVKVIKEAVERGAALVQQLLTSARQAEARMSLVDVNELCRELERMLQATFPKTIRFGLDLQPSLPAITADRSQLHQVLLNLCVNARDAMPNGGSIRIATSLAGRTEVGELFTGAEAAHYACIRVQDTGSGMTPEVKAHIFEPFFTTKERAKGTGLGLSVVYGVVNNHRGFVRADSEPEAGTVFSIYLPVAKSSAAAGSGGLEVPPQTVLLVEDEEMLRDLGVEILQGEGYRILTARDGVEAVEIFAANKDNIGLVVCDLGLPRLGGREAFLQMKAMKPSVRAIVASGYLEPSMRSDILKAGVMDTVQKPYDFRDLVEKIRAIIGKAESEDDHPQLF
jgi:signal transduction histidine kinase/ActR/RegA family two-component response regulator